MSDETPKVGSISWMDLTVTNAEEVKDFYKEVVGWSTSSVNMGDYEDYCMNLPETENTVAGVCHAKGVNAALPSQWLLYITVANVEESISKCKSLSGKVLHTRKTSEGKVQFAIIKDPAGAVCALYQQENLEK